MRRLAAALIALVLGGAGCRGAGDVDDGGDLDARAARLDAALASADSGSAGSEPIARWLLPTALAEISGLALTPDGRLFTHDDESSRITEIDYRRGTVTKHFFVGRTGWRGDFEGLAYARDRFFLLESNGTLYEFREGAEGEQVNYVAHDTHLGKECEFEGVAYDSTANALILSCKEVGTEVGTNHAQDILLLYRYRLDDRGVTEISEISVPYSEAIGTNGWKKLRPSDITVDPRSGNYVLVASQQQALLALTPTGEVVFSRPLEGRHPQAEGIAITRDGILIISDEATKTAAAITLYRWP